MFVPSDSAYCTCRVLMSRGGRDIVWLRIESAPTAGGFIRSNMALYNVLGWDAVTRKAPERGACTCEIVSLLSGRCIGHYALSTCATCEIGQDTPLRLVESSLHRIGGSNSSMITALSPQSEAPGIRHFFVNLVTGGRGPKDPA